MEALFHIKIQHLPKYETPSLKGFTTRQPEDTENILNPTLQEKYRSGVGTILYLTKITRPYLSNISRELSKVMKKSTLGYYK